MRSIPIHDMAERPDPSAVPDYRADTKLNGQAFVVLGAGAGIGAQSCHALRQAGAQVLCADIDGAAARATAEGVGGRWIEADVTAREGMQRVFDEAGRHFAGRFAGVVDVVGVNHAGTIPSFDDARLSRQFDIVLRHALLAVQIGAPLLAANGGGSMTFIGSISGLATLPNQAVYGTAKAALHQLVRYAALEFGPSGVRVNAIAPGYTRTPRLVQMRSAEQWALIEQSNPLRRAADPSDIARAVLFLSSGLARYVTGNVLVLDGGASNATSIPRLQ